jgi:hypothetical protein
LVLGTETFARSLKPGLRVKEREQRQAGNLARPVAWKEIILTVEPARGEPWAEFSGRHGDWGQGVLGSHLNLQLSGIPEGIRGEISTINRQVLSRRCSHPLNLRPQHRTLDTFPTSRF